MTKTIEKAIGETGRGAGTGPLPPAARRALEEAEARRRAAAEITTANRAKEVGGRDGPDPTRYGDWEKDGLAKDF